MRAVPRRVHGNPLTSPATRAVCSPTAGRRIVARAAGARGTQAGPLGQEDLLRLPRCGARLAARGSGTHRSTTRAAFRRRRRAARPPPSPRRRRRALPTARARAETKKPRDACVISKGEEFCRDEIEAHKACLRADGFDVR